MNGVSIKIHLRNCFFSRKYYFIYKKNVFTNIHYYCENLKNEMNKWTVFLTFINKLHNLEVRTQKKKNNFLEKYQQFTNVIFLHQRNYHRQKSSLSGCTHTYTHKNRKVIYVTLNSFAKIFFLPHKKHKHFFWYSSGVSLFNICIDMLYNISWWFMTAFFFLLANFSFDILLIPFFFFLNFAVFLPWLF